MAPRSQNITQGEKLAIAKLKRDPEIMIKN
jgi:hypothetical protein